MSSDGNGDEKQPEEKLKSPLRNTVRVRTPKKGLATPASSRFSHCASSMTGWRLRASCHCIGLVLARFVINLALQIRYSALFRGRNLTVIRGGLVNDSDLRIREVQVLFEIGRKGSKKNLRMCQTRQNKQDWDQSSYLCSH